MVKNFSDSKKDFSEESLKKESLKTSIKEGYGTGVMEGFGIRYITPYALALGANSSHIGFLTSIPALLASVSQLFSVQFLDKLSRKKMLIYSVLFQAILWIPLILIGALFFFRVLSVTFAVWLLILIYTMIMVAGTIPVPAWSSWMKDLLTDHPASYFGKRIRAVGIVSLISMLIAALILDFFNELNVFMGFALLFSIAFFGRLISVYFFRKQYEPEITYEQGYYFSLWSFVKRIPDNNFGRFALYTSLFSFATALASPFFAVYMLKDLGFNYLTFTTIIVSSSLAMLAFMPFWGKFSDRFGNIHALRISGFLIPIIPILWLLSPYFIAISKTYLIVYLVFVEVIAGFLWGGFYLSSGTFANVAVSRQKMALCVAYFHILSAVGVFMGAILGGLIANLNSPIFGIKAILFVFFLSGLARFLVSVLILPKLKEAAKVEKLDLHIKEKTQWIIPRNFWPVFGVRRFGNHSQTNTHF